MVFHSPVLKFVENQERSITDQVDEWQAAVLGNKVVLMMDQWAYEIDLAVLSPDEAALQGGRFSRYTKDTFDSFHTVIVNAETYTELQEKFDRLFCYVNTELEGRWSFKVEVEHLNRFRARFYFENVSSAYLFVNAYGSMR